MKKLHIFFTILIFSILLIFSQYSFANVQSSSDSVDLVFTIGSNKYISKGATLELDVAPLIEGESTLVPFRVILEELGYLIQWNQESSSIIATRGSNVIKLQIGNKKATVGKIEKEMTVAPKIVGDRTMIPLRFIAENSGANVVWFGNTKTIYITRLSQYDTGKIMIYEKQSKGNNIHIYDGTNIDTIPLENNEVVNWYTYKGQILLTVFDKATNNNKFVIYSNSSNRLNTLISNFDIKDTFEYNNNLLIHGYDRSTKMNKLYRFDGKLLTLISDNFYVGEKIIFNDKLLINKYDNKRSYSMVVFDKDSWTPKKLVDKFIIKNNVVFDNTLYLYGSWEQGLEKPLALYDGKSTSSSSFKILNSDVPNLDINNIISHKGTVYYLVSGSLKKIDSRGVNDVYFYDNSLKLYIKYNIKAMELYNGNLYLGATSAQAYEYSSSDKKYKSVSWPKDKAKFSSCVLVTSDVDQAKVFINDISFLQFLVENDTLFIHGKNRTGENSYNEYILYLYDAKSKYNITKILDVIKIKDVLTIDNNIIISVQDIDRITNTNRENIILYKNNSATNLVTNVDIKNWDNINGNMIFLGYEKEVKRNKIYSYGNKFNELMGNVDVKYWNKFTNRLFVNALDNDTKTYSILEFVDNKYEVINSNIEVLKMVKTKGKYYLVYGIDKDKESSYYNKKLLYLFDHTNNSLVLLKDNISIENMIYIE